MNSQKHEIKLDLATIKLWGANARITMGETEENSEEWVAARAVIALSDDLLTLLASTARPILPMYRGRLLVSQEGLELIRDGILAPTKLEVIEMARALLNGAHPVSEHKGWIKGQFAYQDLFNAIGAAVVSKHPSIEISVKEFEASMLAAADLERMATNRDQAQEGDECSH